MTPGPGLESTPHATAGLSQLDLLERTVVEWRKDERFHRRNPYSDSPAASSTLLVIEVRADAHCFAVLEVDHEGKLRLGLDSTLLANAANTAQPYDSIAEFADISKLHLALREASRSSSIRRRIPSCSR